MRGDANADGENLNVSDAVYLLQYLFESGTGISCRDAADANDDERTNLADAVYLLQFLFVEGPRIPAPYPDCGIDTTGEGQLGCESYPPCQDQPAPELLN
jgi:hypothetical protein